MPNSALLETSGETVKYKNKLKNYLVVTLTFFFTIAIHHSQAVQMSVEVIGEAVDLSTQEYLYSEIHCVDAGALVREVFYKDIDHQLIAHKNLSYKTGPATPSVVQNNFYANESIFVDLQGDELTMNITVDAVSALDVKISRRSPPDLPLVIDAGFDAFVLKHWNVLLDGESKSFQFPFARQERLIDLRIQLAACTYQTETDKCFTVEVDNWVLRMLLAPIELGYDPGLKRLSRFRGLSNIGDGSGGGQEVEIIYSYDALPAVSCTLDDMLASDVVNMQDSMIPNSRVWSL
jgi:hypothetical protein